MKDQVDALVQRGRVPLVLLDPGTEVVQRRHRLPHRPRVRDPLRPFAHYAGRRGKSHPRCLRRGCHKRLRVKQQGYCSSTCADLAVNDALYRLREAGVSLEELLTLYGGDHAATGDAA